MSPRNQPLTYPTDGTASAEELRLVRLSKVEGVNALTPGERDRVLREPDDPVRGKRHRENGVCSGPQTARGVAGCGRDRARHPRNRNVTPTARIDFRLGETEDDADLAQRGRGLAVHADEHFRQPCGKSARRREPVVRLHAGGDFAVRLCQRGHSGHPRTRMHSIQRDNPTTNPFLRYFQRGTTVYQHIEALGAATDLPSLETLNMLPANAAEEKRPPRPRSSGAEVGHSRENAASSPRRRTDPRTAHHDSGGGRGFRARGLQRGSGGSVSPS